MFKKLHRVNGFWAALGAAALDWAQSEWQASMNESSAARNRNFQERMSNTSYQRSAADLQAAGLNRVLALGQGATTPSGAQSSVDKPSAAQTGIMAASARQQIKLQKAEEELIGQRELESKSSEDLNKVAAITSATQGQLNVANAKSALEQAKLLQEQARKVRLEADRGEVLNPFYGLAADLSKWIENALRSSAKDDGKPSELKKFFDDALHEVQTGEGIKKWFNSDTPDPKFINDQKWPKFKRGKK